MNEICLRGYNYFCDPFVSCQEETLQTNRSLLKMKSVYYEQPYQ